MKKFFALLLVFTSLMTFAACGGNASPSADPVISADKTSSGAINSDSPQNSLPAIPDIKLPTDADREKWPTDWVHADLPEYTKGTFNGWNNWDENNIFMVIKDTNEDDLEEYVALLESAGFEEVNGDTYRKGLFDVTFQFNSTVLQIDCYKTESFEWPQELASVPVIKAGDLTGVIEPTDDMPGYVQLYYYNITEEDIETWLKELESAGFTVEYGSASKENVQFLGKTYASLSIQPQDNGSNEWYIDFVFE